MINKQQLYKSKLIGITCLCLIGGEQALALTCAQIQPPAYNASIYVSPKGVDNTTCGTVEAPCQTIQEGILHCSVNNQTGSQSGCAVFVRYGLYAVTSPVQLANGIDVYGSCVFDDADPRYRTTVTGSPAFTASSINTKTLLQGFVVMGTDGSQPGQASIAMTVSGSSGLTISRSVLTSGKGADSTSPGAVDGTAGGGGLPRNNNSGGAGGLACSANPTTTGMGGQGADFQQVYSSGCFVGCACSNNNYPNSEGRVGTASGAVQGGNGGLRSDQQGCMCGANGDPGDGGTGSPGNPGACGTSGGGPSPDAKGTFSGITWTSTQGGSGDSGQVGSGGGGGGSGGMATVVGGPDIPGLPGGGGGGGGCGGNGGAGGRQGGASIPLVLSQSTITGLDVDNALIPGPGGTGGNGASGGKGGPGGAGDPGPKGHQTHVEQALYCSGNAPGSGGKGGAGGQGGAGSGGAGGNGGPSSGIALVNSSNNYSSVVIYPTQPGTKGSGGAGGNNSSSQCTGAGGHDGVLGASDLILTFTDLGRKNPWR